MKFDVVNMYYPNEWRRATNILSSESFNWFLCSYRILDSRTNLYYLSVSPDMQFYCISTGKSFLARGLSKRGEGIPTKIVRARLIILSDLHNKQILCSRYKCPVKCDSKRSILSTKCKLVTDIRHIKCIAQKIVKDFGFDGVAIRHECIEKVLDLSDMPVCQKATFVFQNGILENFGDIWPVRCGIVRYAKKNSSCIREVLLDFPTCSEIDEVLEAYPCSIVSRVLYEYIVEYIKKYRKEK